MKLYAHLKTRFYFFIENLPFRGYAFKSEQKKSSSHMLKKIRNIIENFLITSSFKSNVLFFPQFLYFWVFMHLSQNIFTISFSKFHQNDISGTNLSKINWICTSRTSIPKAMRTKGRKNTSSKDDKLSRKVFRAEMNFILFHRQTAVEEWKTFCL